MAKSPNCENCALYNQCTTGLDTTITELEAAQQSAINTVIAQRQVREELSKAHQDTLAWVDDTEQTVDLDTLPEHLKNIGEVYDEAIASLEPLTTQHHTKAAKFNASLRRLRFRRDLYGLFLAQRGDECRGPSTKRRIPWLKATRTCNAVVDSHIKATVEETIVTDIRFEQALTDGAPLQVAHEALLDGQFGP